MSSREVVKASFRVQDVDGTDILEAAFDDEAHSVKQINLNDDTQCQADLKETFLLMAHLMVDKDLEITFIESEDYPREFIYAAMKAYVEDLKTEVANVAGLIGAELKESKEAGNSAAPA